MRFLFVHQNFPGQFKFSAPALAQRGHQVVALCMRKEVPAQWQGVQVISYGASRSTTPGGHPWLGDFETKTIRGEACFAAARRLKQQGFEPDVIVAHPGWGESLFLKEVWPRARLGIYCEFHYSATGTDIGFDPEFPVADLEAENCRITLKNLNNRLHFDIADAGVSPTFWQASTFPEPFRGRITVVHDGIDTQAVAPDDAVSIRLQKPGGTLSLDRRSEVVTFVNRNLEPYRGYHVFMRALPEILRRRPQAQVLVVGGDDVSYGAAPAGGRKWKDIYIDEVRSRIPGPDWARVHFLGNLPYQQFIPVLQLSSVHVYLTYPFVLSWSLLEAMSAGAAIVASRTAPLLEAISHGETGRLVDFFDAESLAGEVCDLLGDAAQRARLGHAARQFARDRYDLRQVCLPRHVGWMEGLAG